MYTLTREEKLSLMKNLNIVGLWGVEAIKELYTEELTKRIWPKNRRNEYDFALAVLRKEPLPTARWGDEHFLNLQKEMYLKSQRFRFFIDNDKSYRWYM